MDNKDLIGWADHRFKAVVMSGYLSLASVLGTLLISVIGNNNDLDLPLTVVVIAGVLFSMLLGMGGLDDIAALGRDADSLANTNFGKNWRKAPFAMFKSVLLLSQLLMAVFTIMFFYK
jgi:hypothetical protein